MPSERMCSRERWQAVLERQESDRFPMDYWATAEASPKLVKHLECADRDDALAQLHVDRPLTIGPRYVRTRLEWGQDVSACPYTGVPASTDETRDGFCTSGGAFVFTHIRRMT